MGKVESDEWIENSRSEKVDVSGKALCVEAVEDVNGTR